MLTSRPADEVRRIEHDVLEVVQGLVEELGGPPAGRPASLDDSLERHLGLGSLERVELVLRLERAFGVRFPDAVTAEAESPRDLVDAILAGAPVVTEAAAGPSLVPSGGVTLPATAVTLVAALRHHAESRPERVHIVLREEDGRERPITYGQLWEGAGAVAAGLRTRGLAREETVAVMLRTEEAFFRAFFGVLLAGGIPVPLYPPFRPGRLMEYARRQAGILRNAGARRLLTFPEAERLADLLRPRVPGLDDVTVIDRVAVPGGAPPPLALDATSPALIQYTSGSTGDPKGVLLSHGNVLANIRAIGDALGIRADDIAVSWLPLYHDMGLIGSWLGALYFGVPIVILSPLAFLARPARWLVALSTSGGTVSAAPNFAFDLCARKVQDDEIRGLDLSRWRLALNGSEPVSADTIERFVRRFEPYGFRREAMCPVYGLAESAVALTFTPPGRGARVDRVAREPFQRTREARPAAPDEVAPIRLVSCGRPLPGHDVRVVDREGRPVEDRREGSIEFRGPSVTAGYFRNPETTRAAWRDGWMNSGDLGYWADGELFVTGRQKDMIIKAGRNLYPQEIEEMVGDIPGVRKGCAAAFGVPDPEVGTERLVVIAETREIGAAAREQLRARILESVVAGLGIPPDTIVVTGPGAVLKTSSGKIRRAATREAYLAGRLERRPQSAWIQQARLLLESGPRRLISLARLGARVGFAAWVGCVLAVVLPALWARLLLARPGRPTNRVLRRWCRALLAACGCPVRVVGLEHLERAGPVVLAANHASYLDAVALLAALPADVRFVAKRELAVSPIVGIALRKGGHLLVERVDLSRSVQDAERVTALLARGASILIFPEGTFRRAPVLRPFRMGAFSAAVAAGRPVIPVALRGTRHILPADTWLPRPGTITVTIGPPIPPEASDWREMVRIRDLTRAEIARGCGEPAGHP